MEKYEVKLLPHAHRDLDEIYAYIAKTRLEPSVAAKLIDSLEEAALSLETMPRRGTLRRIGLYACKGYRQLFVEKFIIVYRIDEAHKQVIVVTIRYAHRQF